MTRSQKTYLVTGGAGFIGSCFVLMARKQWGHKVINLDALTYSGNLANLADLKGDEAHIFVHGSINDRALLRQLLFKWVPDAIIHFAAESHVDRSIASPEIFVSTNVLGTFSLLEETFAWWRSLAAYERKAFRFLHVSTDEVFGSLDLNASPFSETTPYAPNSPYSASKAASDHFVRAFHETYGLPVLISNCSNNYGPRQFPEKLIPLMIVKGLAEEALPVYGSGDNIRDWLYVEDHCEALETVLRLGKNGETYNIGGKSEMKNIDLVAAICSLLDEWLPAAASRSNLITFVADRLGHDFRYAMDISKIGKELGWFPKETFQSGLQKTVKWYLENRGWLAGVQTGAYREWTIENYVGRSMNNGTV